MAEVSPVKTPTRSIIRHLEPGSITPNAIEELSSQIDSLIQRGRRLRDLKSSLTKSSPRKAFQETQASAFEASSIPIDTYTGRSVFDETLAVLNASDPLFCEDIRIPPEAAREAEKPSLTPVQNESQVVTCIYALGKARLSRGGLELRLRTKSQVSTEQVSGDTDSDVALEAWKGSELVGMGRKTGNVPELPHEVSLDVFDVWEGVLLGKVVLHVKKVVNNEPASIPPFSLPQVPVVPPMKPLDAVPTTRNSIRIPRVEKGIQSSPRPVEIPRTSIESFVSFLSRSPDRPDDLILTDDEQVSEAISRIEEEAISHVQAELSSARDVREVLMRKIKELDRMTSRLESGLGTFEPDHELKPQYLPILPNHESRADIPDSILHVESSQVVDSRASTTSPPAVAVKRTTLAAVRRKNRRRARSRTGTTSRLEEAPTVGRPSDLIEEVLPPRIGDVQDGLGESTRRLSVVSTIIQFKPTETAVLVQPAPSSLSSKRKESIEKARRTISSLRKSFLKDADRMCSVLSREDSN